MITECVPGETCYIIDTGGIFPITVLGFATTMKDMVTACRYCLRIRLKDGSQTVAAPCVIFSAQEALASKLSGILPNYPVYRGKCSICEGVI